ncbi:hypothetical protein NPIL_421741 [Nephila pilipes]|uniref:Uncharacterized protein n=1 Tax=Nephila pilipes TaxID=299642 RepID=A0A8X6NY09_NEPPI|nr:hypothetical protein NPIL_421741 [Nephila pilipes]
MCVRFSDYVVVIHPRFNRSSCERGNDHQADERVVKPSRDEHASVKHDVHSGSRYSSSRNEIAFDQTGTWCAGSSNHDQGASTQSKYKTVFVNSI